ncbi:MAG TPA: carboxypeptidase-like regulatory domain-containing protein [Myxococcaceae bacterium]
MSGVVRDTAGVVIEGASVSVRSLTATTGADGRFELQNLTVGRATITTSAPGFDPHSESVGLIEGTNTHDVVLTPTPKATLSGVVRAVTGAVIEGASVSIGSATATTGADGRYELQNLPVGSAMITTSAPGFDPRSESVSLNEGANVHDVVLGLQTLFTHQNAVAYLPLGIAEYKAAIVFLPGLRDPATGNPLDSRALVRGTSDGACSIWCPQGERTEVRKRALELAGGNVALIGTTTLVDDAASYETLLQALSEFGTQSQHPELANIPIFFVGHSMGGCTAYGFSRVHGARVAGFLTMKGACHNTGPALAAGDVPGHFLIGELDEPYRRENITAVFEAGRAAGAPWAVSIDPFHHGPILDFDLMFDWIDTVLTARLPATPGGPLRPMTETAGWLGNRSTGAISTHGCFDSNRSSASWLPSRETARDWQRMAGGTVVVSGC